VKMLPYYQQSGMTIYHNRWEDVLPTLPSRSIDLVVTSPPYNLGSRYANASPKSMQGKWSRIIQYGDYDDNLPEDIYCQQQQSLLRELWRLIKDTGAIFYNHRPRIQNGLCDPRIGLIPSELQLRQLIVWKRPKGHNFNDGYFVPSYEFIFLLAKPAFVLNKGCCGMGDVWEMSPATAEQDHGHPAPFPEEFPMRAINSSANVEVVLDPYLGSGSTLRAAKNLGKCGVGIDINEGYCRLAAQRLGQEILQMEVV